MIELDNLVMLAVRNRRRRLDRLELLLGKIRLSMPHRSEAAHELRPFLRMRREARVLALCPCDIGCKDLRLGAIWNKPGQRAVGAKCEQLRHQIWFGQSELKSGDRTVAPADDGHKWLFDRGEELFHILCKKVVTELVRGHRASPVAARIH